MLNYVLWNGPEGREESAVGVSSPAQLPSAPEGCEWHLLAGDINARTLALVDGVLTEVDRVPPLPVAKLLRWQAAKVIKAERQAGGCSTPTGPVQTDPDSQRTISLFVAGAQAAKQAGAPWGITFTLADNSRADLDADGMIALGAAVSAHINACQDAAEAIRVAIDAAPDAAALAAVDLTAGYPSLAFQGE